MSNYYAPPASGNNAGNQGSYSNYGPASQQQPVYVQQGGNNNDKGFHPGSNSWNWCCGLLNCAMCLEMFGFLVNACV